MLGVLMMAIMATAGCHEKASIDGERLRQEMNDRVLKRITPGELTNAANSYGSRICAVLDTGISRGLARAAADTATCRPYFAHLADSLGRYYQVGIARLGYQRDTASLAGLDPKEREVYMSYRYEAEAGRQPGANLQRSGDTVLFYTQPIMLNRAKCGGCHKVAGNGAAPAMGIYNIRFSKRQLIRNYNFK
jgi:hypothetical protein